MTEQTDNRNALPRGYCLGDYEIQNVLGEGAFGITYLAKDTKQDNLVAIKEYLPNVIAIREADYTVHAKSHKDEENFTWAADRFIQEAKILAKFKHPNIVKILFCFQANNTAYIIMEYEQGQSLEKLLKEGKTFTEEELLRLFLPLLDGLELVHKSDYIHRDIKPENIYFRDRDHSLVLIDFGAARYEVSSRSQTITAILTPGYAPFEQYETKGNWQGPWTDIYALAAVLYRLISGKIPVDSSERIGAIIRGQADPLTPAVEIGSGQYSQQLLESIDWGLKIKEKERPQSVKKWRNKLLGKATPIPTQPEPTSVEFTNRPKKPMVANNSAWKWRLVGVGVLLLLVISTIAVYFIPKPNPVTDDNKLANTKQALHIAELEKQIEIAKADKARLEREALEKQRRQQATERASQEAERRRIAREDKEERRLAKLAAQISHKDIKPVFTSFMEAWNNKQYRRLMSYISSDFYSVDKRKVQNYDKYAAGKKKLFKKYSWISVTASNIRYSFNGNEATVTYYQHFNSPSYESKGTNKVYFRKSWGETKIFKEEFERDWYQVKKRNKQRATNKPTWCSRASTRTERRICNSNDAELWALENKMVALYRQVKIAGQGSWLRNVRNQCTNVSCLKQVYRERVSQMEDSF